MAKRKRDQKCPHCGRMFVYLSRHKCKLAPKDEDKKSSKKSSKKSKKRRNYSEIDKQVFLIIEKVERIYFHELHKKLEDEDISAKILKNSLERLAKKHKITLCNDLQEGVRRERIDLVEQYDLKDSESLTKGEKEFLLDSFGNCPCFLCPVVDRCSTGQNELNPVHCEHLKEWLRCNIEGEEYDNPFTEDIEEEPHKKSKRRRSRRRGR